MSSRRKILLAALAGFCALPLGVAAQTVADGSLTPYTIVGDGIPASLTGVPGDPAAGRRTIEDRKLGNCASCHVLPFATDDPGTIGPDLHGIGSLFTPAQLRLRLVNMKRVDPQTIMPAYYRVDGLRGVSPAFAGKPILTAQQIEDVVAFLASATSTGAKP
jgi:sulfur-oxidizing protein SoxX